MTSPPQNGPRLVRIWVDGWQQECCGDGWAVGDVVSWTVEAPDRAFLDPLFAPGSGVKVDWGEEHHSESSKRLASLSGTVARIDGVQLAYEAMPSGSATMEYPVAGSAVLTELPASNGDELRSRGFAGYVVALASSRLSR